MQVLLSLCPEADAVIVVQVVGKTERDMTTIASVPPELAVKLLREGIEDYETKPVDQLDLATVVEGS